VFLFRFIINFLFS